MINNIISAIFFDAGASDINVAVKINPQKIKALFFILSAKNPK